MPASVLMGFETTTGKQAELLIDNGELRVSAQGSGSITQRPVTDTPNSISAVGVFVNENGTANYKSMKCDASGHLLVASDSSADSIQVVGNTSKDGTGTKYHMLLDADGKLKTSYPSNITTTDTGDVVTTVTAAETPKCVIAGGNLGTNPTHIRNAIVDDTNSLKTSNENITVGRVATGAADSLQQVLMYGKNPADGTLQPLSTSGTNLLVNIGEITVDTQVTAKTSLASMQVCGFDTGTTQFKSLKCDGSGVLQVNDTGGGGTSGSAQAQYTVAVPTLTDTEVADMRLDVSGNLLTKDDILANSSAQGSTAPVTSKGLRLVGNSNIGLTGTETNVCVDGGGRVFVTSDTGFEIDAKNDAGAGKDVRCDDNGRLYAGLVAYTNIADDTTSVRLKCSAAGVLDISSGGGGTGGAAQGQYTTAAPTLTNAQISDLRLDVNGRLLVSDNSGGGGGTGGAAQGQYTIATPTLADTDVADLRLDVNGKLITLAAPKKSTQTIYNTTLNILGSRPIPYLNSPAAITDWGWFKVDDVDTYSDVVYSCLLSGELDSNQFGSYAPTVGQVLYDKNNVPLIYYDTNTTVHSYLIMEFIWKDTPFNIQSGFNYEDDLQPYRDEVRMIMTKIKDTGSGHNWYGQIKLKVKGAYMIPHLWCMSSTTAVSPVQIQTFGRYNN